MESTFITRFVYYIVFFVAVFYGYRIYRLAPRKALNIFGALTLLFTGLLAFVEHEIFLQKDANIVVYFDKVHTSIAVLLVMFANIMGNLFIREKIKWIIQLERIILFILLLCGIVLLFAIITTNDKIVYNIQYIEGIWTYNVKQGGLWAIFYELWFVIGVFHLSLTFFRSFWTAESLTRKRIHFFIFLVFSIIPLFLIYEFIISPNELATGSYFVSPLLICCVLGLNWVFTDFQLFKINPSNAVDNLLDSVSSLVIILNSSLRIKFFNDAFKKAVGEEGIGELNNIHIKDLLSWVNANLEELDLERIDSLKKGEQVESLIVVTNSPTDTRYFMAIVSPVFNYLSFKTGFVIICNEITENRRQEEALKNYTEELELSNQELERFAHVASHDLKSPLRNINSFVNLIERRLDLKKDPKLQEYLQFVTNSVSYMYSLIQDILEYSTLSHKEKVREQEVDLNEIIEKAKETLAIQIEKGASIKAEPMPKIMANSSLLFQLFFNLIENGLKYNQNQHPEVLICVKQKEDEYLFEIKDNGIGIDPKFDEQIFEMFSRLHVQTTYEGTGIGLAICKKIVHLYGGEIWMNSKIGEGTSFFFTLKCN